MNNEEILSKCTGLTINDEDAYIIHTKTENILKAMQEARADSDAKLQKAVEALEKAHEKLIGIYIYLDVSDENRIESCKFITDTLTHIKTK